MNIFKFFKVEKCKHDKVPFDLETAYCPDCGKLIKNEWYITRCACCGIKLKTYLDQDGNARPQNRFCTNCGADAFVTEKLEKIDFININFAALKRSDVSEEQKEKSSIQCWEEKTIVQPKLLTQYL